MKIDRDRFLVLTATLAMGFELLPTACATGEPPPAVAQPPAPAPAPAPAPTVIYVIAPATTGPAPIPSATQETSPQPQPDVASNQTRAKIDPYEGTPIKGQSCDPALDAKGSPPACSLRAPGPTCESFADTKAECPTMNKLLKPRVAQAAIECMNRRSGTADICEFNVSSICAYEALQSACVDPAAKVACNNVVARCGGGTAPKGHYNKMTRDACEAGVSGIADAKRAKFISCITEFCRFEVCLTYL